MPIKQSAFIGTYTNKLRVPIKHGTIIGTYTNKLRVPIKQSVFIGSLEICVPIKQRTCTGCEEIAYPASFTSAFTFFWRSGNIHNDLNDSLRKYIVLGLCEFFKLLYCNYRRTYFMTSPMYFLCIYFNYSQSRNRKNIIHVFPWYKHYVFMLRKHERYHDLLEHVLQSWKE